MRVSIKGQNAVAKDKRKYKRIGQAWEKGF